MRWESLVERWFVGVTVSSRCHVLSRRIRKLVNCNKTVSYLRCVNLSAILYYVAYFLFYIYDLLCAQAMCSNIKELLLYYRSALHRIFNRYKFLGLLSLLERIRPMADLIMEVAKLCSCVKYNRFVTNGGSGILTHIYKEVTKITNPKVALVFYSILKSCCEVYFR